jgi:hypothetical protein
VPRATMRLLPRVAASAVEYFPQGLGRARETERESDREVWMSPARPANEEAAREPAYWGDYTGSAGPCSPDLWLLRAWCAARGGVSGLAVEQRSLLAELEGRPAALSVGCLLPCLSFGFCAARSVRKRASRCRSGWSGPRACWPQRAAAPGDIDSLVGRVVGRPSAAEGCAYPCVASYIVAALAGRPSAGAVGL